MDDERKFLEERIEKNEKLMKRYSLPKVKSALIVFERDYELRKDMDTDPEVLSFYRSEIDRLWQTYSI